MDKCNVSDLIPPKKISNGVPSPRTISLRSDDTEAVSAKNQACPHLAVHAHPDDTLETGATEMGAAIRFPSWSETLPEERRRLNRSPPPRRCGLHVSVH